MRIGEHWALATSSGAGAASITAAETAAYLRGSALASSTLRKIWRLSDTRPPRGQLTKDEVIDKKSVCTIYQKKRGFLRKNVCVHPNNGVGLYSGDASLFKRVRSLCLGWEGCEWK